MPIYDDTILYEYSYGNTQWRDLLTSISIKRNNATNPEAIGNYTYDEIGNPKQYYNVYNNTTWTLGWFANRSLRQAKTGSTTINYEYDLDGLRTKKSVGGVVHNYVYDSGKLLRESYTQNSTSYTLDFVYDQNGRPYMLYLTEGNNDPKIFYYLLNYQGDVVRIVDDDGATAAEYRYDAWGKSTEAYTTSGSTVQNLAAINPLRYRGYYYDTETGWYYLQSRYYDPGLGRFINADCYTSTGQGFVGYNMFAYCGNNPGNNSDPIGTFIISGTTAAIIGVGALVAGVSGLVGGYNAQKNGGSFWGGFVFNAVLYTGVYALSYFVGPEIALEFGAIARAATTIFSDLYTIFSSHQEWTAQNIALIVMDPLCDAVLSVVFYGNISNIGLSPPVEKLIDAVFDWGVDFILDFGNQNNQSKIPLTFGHYENNRGYPVTCNYSSNTRRSTSPIYHEDACGFPHSY